MAKKMIFFQGKGSWFSPRIIREKAFHIAQVLMKKIWVEKSVSTIQHIGNRKRVLGDSPPLIKLSRLHTVVVLQYTI